MSNGNNKAGIFRGVDLYDERQRADLIGSLAKEFNDTVLKPGLAAGAKRGDFYVIDMLEEFCLTVLEGTEGMDWNTMVAFCAEDDTDIVGRKFSLEEGDTLENIIIRITMLKMAEEIEDEEQIDEIMTLLAYQDDCTEKEWNRVREKALEVATGNLDRSIQTSGDSKPVWDSMLN